MHVHIISACKTYIQKHVDVLHTKMLQTFSELRKLFEMFKFFYQMTIRVTLCMLYKLRQNKDQLLSFFCVLALGQWIPEPVG